MAGALYPSDRFQAATCYAALCSQYKDAAASLRAHKLVIELVQSMVSPSLPLVERYRNISAVREAIDAAVAAAIEAGDPTLALLWFEHGRCIVWGHILRLRIPVDELRSEAPDLAAELDDVFGQISDTERIVDMPYRTPGQIQAVYRYGDLVDRFDDLVSRARQLPGKEAFLQPRTLEELKETTALGPVIAVHVDKARCDALILQHGRDDVLHVPLPQLTLQSAERMRNFIRRSLTMSGTRAIRPSVQRQLTSMGPSLSALWTRVVGPVFAALGLSQSESHLLPRITWCASGPLALLPFHAAGIYNGKQKFKAFEYATHSYTPSLSALLSAYRQSLAPVHAEHTIFIASQPATPGQIPLPGTVTEVETIQRVVGASKLSWLNDTDATAGAVLDQIGQHSWVHLACHAVQNSEDPMESGFLLHDGSVSLRAIMRRTTLGRNALAVLSACQTAMGDNNQPEEAMHLAAGMLMTGFRSVVGTMWSIGDSDAPVVIEAFYSYLMRNAGGDSRQSAHALHHAVGRLRESVGEENFTQWVPFVHYGI
ncbi:CHAT domain-containing protein [Vararia minispora EC-137]|uniref:CHAT domain-containing protein n=1 Tax=Vararia minispora EC-137 TaxID=1314806 RepID=A0ACB8Q4I2_9AGAM|nr:CHAT domain-containing protein [Vararia minispora EC-137]